MSRREIIALARAARAVVLCLGATTITYLTAWATFRAIRQTDVGTKAGLLSLAVAAFTLGLTFLSLARRRHELGQARLAEIADDLRLSVLVSEEVQRARLLGDDVIKIDLAFELHQMPGRNADGAAVMGHLDDVDGYYSSLAPRRLAIIGAPGSGKTVMALELLVRLLQSESAGGAVPVRFSLSGWPEGWQMRSWLAQELAEAYRLPLLVAEMLLNAKLVIPFLDGLDEMDSDDGPPVRAAAALEAMNSVRDGTQSAPLVLTCREQQYQALAEYLRPGRPTARRLLDAATIRISAVTAEQAIRYIQQRTDDRRLWDPIIEDLADERSSVLAASLSTPWRLALAVTVYGGFLKSSQREAHSSSGSRARDGWLGRKGDPQAWASPPPEQLIAHSADMDNHLLKEYVRAATSAQAVAGAHSYRPDHAERWLTFLARYLRANTESHRAVGGRTLSGTDVILHQLWPIAGDRAPRLVDMLLAVAMSVPGFAWFAAYCWTRPSYWIGIFAAIAVVYGLALRRVTFAYWISPGSVSPRKLLSWQGLAQLSVATGVGILVAFLFVPWAGAAVGFAALIGGGLSITPTQGLVSTAVRESSPKRPIHVDLIVSLIAGLSGFPVAGLAFSQYLGAVAGWLLGFIYAIAVGCTVASAPWRRYLATLLCTRRHLPWRLARFLDWACTAGMMRVSGIAYQFRHDELRDWLADLPNQPGSRRARSVSQISHSGMPQTAQESQS